MEFHTALDAPCYYGNWYQQRVSLSARPDAARYYGNWYQIYLRQKKAPPKRGQLVSGSVQSCLGQPRYHSAYLDAVES